MADQMAGPRAGLMAELKVGPKVVRSVEMRAELMAAP